MSDNEPLRHLLRDLGYSVLFRRLDWTDCLIRQNGQAEQHFGSGDDEDDAFRAALAHALPSELARRLLDRALAVPATARAGDVLAEPLPATDTTPSLSSAPPAPTIPEPAVGTVETAPPAPVTSAVEPASASPIAPTREPTPSPAPLLDIPTEPAVAVPTAAGDAPTAAPAPPATALVPASAPVTRPPAPVANPPSVRGVDAATRVSTVPLLSADAAIHGLVELLAEADGSSLGALAPEWLRVRLLFWMCRGRGLEERVTPTDQYAVIPACARLARRLTIAAKTFWPGSVRALQLDASPMDVRRELIGLGASHVPFLATWEDAAAAAGALFRRLQENAAALGVDEQGWADGRFLTPPPDQPEHVLAECLGTLTEMLGPGVVARGEVLVEARDHRAPLLTEAALEPLVGVAQRLRWLRAAVPHPIDPLAWGIAMGAVRWATLGFDERGRRRLGEVLQARHRPATSWAALCGVAPATPTPSPEAARAELLQALPSATRSPSDLGGWLLKAFDVWSGPELAKVIENAGAEVLASVPGATFPELAADAVRRCKRRHTALLDHLHRPAASPVVVAPAATEDGDDAELPVQEVERRAGLVRPHVQGKRVLLVSNRQDDALGERLAGLLDCTLTVKEATNTRLNAAAKQIAKGSYDIVLSLTGFQVHGTDTKLQDACGRTGIPYVRVNRGRPLAVVQALARDFGLTA